MDETKEQGMSTDTQALRQAARDLRGHLQATYTDFHYDVADGPITETYRGRRMRVTRATVTEFTDERIEVQLSGHHVNADGSPDARNTTGDTAGYDADLQAQFIAAHLFATGQVH